MQIKMKPKQYFQGSGVTATLLNGETVSILEPDKVYEVEEQMGRQLIETLKAVSIDEVVSMPDSITPVENKKRKHK